MSRNDGKDAEAAFEVYWQRRGHLERLWDAADLRGRNGGRHVGDFPKPADYLVSSRTDPLHFAEVKSCHSKASFAFGCIRPAQSAAALKSARRGDRGYRFYIFSYHLGKWFVMPCTQYAEACERGDRSIKFEDMEPWQQ